MSYPPGPILEFVFLWRFLFDRNIYFLVIGLECLSDSHLEGAQKKMALRCKKGLKDGDQGEEDAGLATCSGGDGAQGNKALGDKVPEPAVVSTGHRGLDIMGRKTTLGLTRDPYRPIGRLLSVDPGCNAQA